MTTHYTAAGVGHTHGTVTDVADCEVCSYVRAYDDRVVASEGAVDRPLTRDERAELDAYVGRGDGGHAA